MQAPHDARPLHHAAHHAVHQAEAQAEPVSQSSINSLGRKRRLIIYGLKRLSHGHDRRSRLACIHAHEMHCDMSLIRANLIHLYRVVCEVFPMRSRSPPH